MNIEEILNLDCSDGTDELIEILGEGVITEVEANRVIMAAREHWFTDENK